MKFVENLLHHIHSPRISNGKTTFLDSYQKMQYLLAGINRKSEALSVINQKLRYMEKTNQTYKLKYQTYKEKQKETENAIDKLVKISKSGFGEKEVTDDPKTAE